jgi:exosortase
MLMPKGSQAEKKRRHTRALVNWVSFFFVCVGGFLLAYSPSRGLFSGRTDSYSHIVLIPIVTAYFLFLDRKKIGKLAAYSWHKGSPVVLAGILLYGLALWQKNLLGANDFASLAVTGVLVFLWGCFLLLFGFKAFGAVRFALFFLAFAIPIPTFLLNGVIELLRSGSTEVIQRLFDLTGTPYFRDGFTFQLPNIAIEIARECSGIRSTIALMITGVLSAHFFLNSGWQMGVLLIAMLPVTIAKNALRILTLSLLAVHVDTRFITDSFLHHSGGFIFYLPALVLMALMIWAFRKVGGSNSEQTEPKPNAEQQLPGGA